MIIIGTPVWAGNYSPPVKTFLSEHKLSKKKIALFACYGGGGAAKCFSRLEKELEDCRIISTLELINPKEKQQDEDMVKIKNYCNGIQ